MRKLLLLLLLFRSVSSIAQDSLFVLSGVVKDNKSTPLEFVNIGLLSATDSSIVKAVVTDVNGTFWLKAVTGKNYLLVFSQVGYQKKYTSPFLLSAEMKFDTIQLKEDAALLDEIEITVKRQFIEHKPGKTIINPENNLSTTGGTVMEVLKKSPGVIADNNGNITLNGKQNVMVFIDGKPTYMTQEQLTNFLNNTPASQVDQIELMTKPPAKYDASGNAGIINIKLKKNKLIGFNGTAYIAYGQGFYHRLNTGINANYRNEKVNVFGFYYYGNTKRFHDFDINRKFKINSLLSSEFKQYSHLVSHDNSNTFRLGTDLFLTPKQTIGFVFNGNMNPSNDVTLNETNQLNASEELQFSSITNSTANDNSKTFSINLNYKIDLDSNGSQFTADADYANFNFLSSQNFFTDNYDSIGAHFGNTFHIRSNVPTDIKIVSGKMDWNKHISKTLSIEAGAKSSFVETDNDVIFYNYDANGYETIDTSKTNHFKYSENINAAYFTFSQEIKKISYQLGLRAEQTLAQGTQLANDSTFTRKYLQLFPTVFVSYKLNKTNQFDISYNRRVDRPSYQDMNPFKYYLDLYTYQQGNPFLIPQITNSVELSHTFMDALTTTVNYSRTNNIIMEVTKQIDSIQTTYATSENLDMMENYSAAIILPIPVAKWFMSINYFSVFYNGYKGDFSGTQLNNGFTTWLVNSENEFTFKKGWSGQITFNYHSPIAYGLFVVKREYDISIGIQKKMLNDRGKLRIGIDNLFFNRATNVFVDFQNMDINLNEINDKQVLRFAFIYNFGKQTVKRSRNHNTGAQDELNRIKK